MYLQSPDVRGEPEGWARPVAPPPLLGLARHRVPLVVLTVTAHWGGRWVAEPRSPCHTREETILKVIKGSGVQARLPPFIVTETQVKLIMQCAPLGIHFDLGFDSAGL